MIVNVIKGEIYNVSCPEVCTVSSPDEGRGEYVLAFMQGGGQAVVQAVSDRLVVSSDLARVVQAHDQNTYAAHAANASIHLSAAERRSLYIHKNLETGAGSSNANFVWFELAEVWLAAGELQAVSIKCRENDGGMTMEPRYLGVWQKGDNELFSPIGVSSNAQVQRANAQLRWVFDGVSISGAPLRFVLLAGRSDGWNTESTFGARVAVDAYGSFLVGNSRLLYVPEMMLEVDVLDTGRKLTAEEAAFLHAWMNNNPGYI